MTYQNSGQIGGKWKIVSGSLLENGLGRLKNRKVVFWPAIYWRKVGQNAADKKFSLRSPLKI